MKEDLVKHFDTLHEVKEVEPPRLGQITQIRQFGNFRSKKMSLKPLGYPGTKSAV